VKFDICEECYLLVLVLIACCFFVVLALLFCIGIKLILLKPVVIVKSC